MLMLFESCIRLIPHHHDSSVRHTRIPCLYADAALVNWVQCQRDANIQRNEGKITDLTDERIEMLNKINFEWKIDNECRSDSI
jgi:hypothetical protein